MTTTEACIEYAWFILGETVVFFQIAKAPLKDQLRQQEELRYLSLSLSILRPGVRTEDCLM